MRNEDENAVTVLRERARALARVPAPASAAEAVLEVIEFSLGPEHYAIESRYVREVSPLKDLTPLPCTPPFIRGVVNVRGRILPVLDLKRFLDLPDKGITDLHCIIFVRANDVELGLLADAIGRVSSVPLGALEPSLPTLTGIHGRYLKGVTAERLIVLDVARILGDPKLIVHEEVES